MANTKKDKGTGQSNIVFITAFIVGIVMGVIFYFITGLIGEAFFILLTALVTALFVRVCNNYIVKSPCLITLRSAAKRSEVFLTM